MGTTDVKAPGLHSVPWIHEGERFSVRYHGESWKDQQVASPNFYFSLPKIEFREGHQQRMPVHCHWPAGICCSLLRPIWSSHQRGVLRALMGAAGRHHENASAPGQCESTST